MTPRVVFFPVCPNTGFPLTLKHHFLGVGSGGGRGFQLLSKATIRET